MENKLTEALKAAIDSGSEVSTNTKGSSLRETNQKRMTHVLYQSEEVKALRETMQRKFGFDMFDNKAFPVQEWNF